jgi:hypothetical protein
MIVIKVNIFPLYPNITNLFQIKRVPDVAGTQIIAMVETIIGNVNHLSKPASLDYSCKP